MEAAAGSFGKSARNVLSVIANAAGKLTGETPSSLAEQFSQRLSLILHVANARSILLRASRQAEPPASLAFVRSIIEQAEARRLAPSTL